MVEKFAEKEVAIYDSSRNGGGTKTKRTLGVQEKRPPKRGGPVATENKNQKNRGKPHVTIHR